jgi:hypothetical protein
MYCVLCLMYGCWTSWHKIKHLLWTVYKFRMSHLHKNIIILPHDQVEIRKLDVMLVSSFDTVSTP